MLGQYLNVGLDSVKLKLAPDDKNAPYLAAFYAMGDLAYGVSYGDDGLAIGSLAGERD